MLECMILLQDLVICLASIRPLVSLLRGVLLELIHCLLLILIVMMLIEVAGRVRVVVTAVDAEGATPSRSILLLHRVVVAPVAGDLLLISQLLISVVSEGLSTLTELVVVEAVLAAVGRESARVSATIAAFVIMTGEALLMHVVGLVIVVIALFVTLDLVMFALISHFRVHCLEWFLIVVRRLRDSS